MSDLATPHDAFFKVTFGDKDVAQDFLKHYLPAQIASAVDLNYLTKENNSFVDERFKESFTDMLYKTKINGEDGYIYFLFEHKSYQDPLVILQLLRYILRIWEEKYDRKTKKLPIIIPMVIYHGESKWNVQTKLINLIKGIDRLPEETKKYIPVYEYELYDLSPFGQVVIVGLALTKVVLEVMQLVMITDTKKFDEAMKKVLEDIAQLPEDKFERFVEACITYILSVRDDVDIGTIEKESREILSERSDVIMSVAEKLRNEGRLEGRLEGEAEGRRKGKIEFVLKNLSKKFGRRFTKEMKEKIQKADEKTIDYIGENLLDISLEQLKEVLK
ncbi:MAG TPA: Rpn family recombination-promoting nuclease/putative transposase [Fervidobacterium sp.]|nr:Rpn family recombination-promoting nuclease/putative transposase [Fervidobacterium sp.]HPT54555.1 Rpn family recombination-promoting nuclease/putative transposase [Fervidobacterium sp.]HPZ18205.1 Rpn family recombination-promoting nuclease/putative transposase [Fervidobacterium sp.]HQE49375.1 Rpn family recombination-promoting nuclease/putative transposase [Fervidobacterium sp.]HUM43016.1 Rpn family recombination-promoting nuclease/putative transposase [Fervidobacterium sp.]